MELSEGTVIDGRYRLERLLGRGGMGAVYSARHLTLGELYAIKFVSPGPTNRDEAHARFRREAKSAALLTSDHVAKVMDLGVHGDDELYIVMEYLEGIDLEVFARRRGPLSVGEASAYVLQACEALAEAHEKNIVHRDIKPANLFLTTSHGQQPLVKVLDFGVSKTLGADMTHTAAMLGSPRYMSPEQMDDPRSVDGRTDIWSLGVVLYRLVSGRLPFEGETLGRVCMAVMRDPTPPLGAARPGLPPGFIAIVDRCLEKDRDRRFATVAELCAALAPYATEPDGDVTLLVEPVTPQAAGAPGLTTDGPFTSQPARPSAEPGEASSASRLRTSMVAATGVLAVVTALVAFGAASTPQDAKVTSAAQDRAPSAAVTPALSPPLPNLPPPVTPAVAVLEVVPTATAPSPPVSVSAARAPRLAPPPTRPAPRPTAPREPASPNPLAIPEDRR